MSVNVYWIAATVVIDWPITGPDGPITDATLAGTVTKPDGTTDTVTPQQVGDIARTTYVPDIPGTYAVALTATGTVTTATEVAFYVRRHLEASEPATFDPATELGQIRLLVADLDPENLLLTDAQLAGYLAIEGDVRRAAAAALEAIAVSEVLVSKVIRTQDLATDGSKVAAELRARAKDLRDQADIADDTADGGLSIVDYVPPSCDIGIWTVP